MLKTEEIRMDRFKTKKNWVLILFVMFICFIFFSPSKTYATTTDTSLISKLDFATGIAIDNQGNVWVGNVFGHDIPNSEINKYNSNGELIKTIPIDGDATGIAVDSQGNIWVSVKDENQNGYVISYNSNGEKLSTFKIDYMPSGIVIDGGGNIWIIARDMSDYNIESCWYLQKFSADGELLKKINPGSHIIGLAKDSNGNICIVNRNAAKNYEILKYNSAFDLLKTIPLEGYPTGLVIDQYGNMWVGDFNQRDLREYSSDGELLNKVYCSIGDVDVYALAIDSDGNMWATDVQGPVIKIPKDALTTHTLTYTADSNGTISGTSQQTVNLGENGSGVTAVAEEGYHFDGWDDGVETATRTDSNVRGDIWVTAYFAIDEPTTHTLTYTAGSYGTISGTSPQTVNNGENGSEATAVADTGYHFVSWSDGVVTETRTDSNVIEDINVTANFAIDAHTLTYTAGSHGTISGTSPQTVNSGVSGAAVTAVANAGYHFVSWSDGIATATRTDINVSEDINVTANFAIDVHTLTYTAGSNGTISGASPQTVNSGVSGVAVTAVANAGYHFVSWSDGVTTATRTDSNVSGNISVTANFVADTPAPNNDGGNSSGSSGSTTLPENKTITVVEVPKSIPSSEMITVEPIGAAFDQSIEVRLKDDKATESTIRATMEATSSTLEAENAQIFPLDISLYIKGTETKVQPAEGTAVKITCPIPTELLAHKDKLVIVSVFDGKLEIIETTVITKDGVSCVEFIATHFSPYAFVLDTDDKLADLATGNTTTDDSNSIKVATKMTVSVGTLTKSIIENLPENATVAYHVCTPTYISINTNGEIFAKKTGKAVLMASITADGTTTVYTITITVKKAKAVTKVGVIQYYDDLITYKNINYRITLKANKTAAGTVAVGNNQLNEKLSTKVVIPSKITLDGITYYVTSIDESAFYNVNHIKSVSIPDTMKNISDTAFTSCDNLKTFIVKSSSPNYSAKSGMLLDKTGTRLIAYPSASGKVVVDSKITTIGAYAFSVCKNLSEIIIPKTVTKIEGCAFAHSKVLTKVTFQSVTVPEMQFLCIFERINQSCVIYVPDEVISYYQTDFENVRQPKGVVIMKK